MKTILLYYASYPIIKTNKHTHTLYTKQKQSKKQSCLNSVHQCPGWQVNGRNNEVAPCLTDEGVGTHSLTSSLQDMNSLSIDVTAGAPTQMHAYLYKCIEVS